LLIAGPARPHPQRHASGFAFFFEPGLIVGNDDLVIDVGKVEKNLEGPQRHSIGHRVSVHGKTKVLCFLGFVRPTVITQEQLAFSVLNQDLHPQPF
jgi:hypothetical protein